jgi:hypothetical protein
MTKREKERLLKLAGFIKKVKPKLFDLYSIIGYESASGPDFEGLKKQIHTCGTTACAVGYVPVVFPRSYKYDKTSEIVCIKDATNDYWPSIGKFFGLDKLEMDYLFQTTDYPYDNRGPKDVAKRIEHFVKTGKMTGGYYKGVI